MTLFDFFAMKTQHKWNEEGKVCVGRLLSKAVDVKGLTDGGQSGDRQAVYTGSSPRDVCTCTCTPLLSEVKLKAIEVWTVLETCWLPVSQMSVDREGGRGKKMSNGDGRRRRRDESWGKPKMVPRHHEWVWPRPSAMHLDHRKTRSSKDECSTRSKNHLRSTDLLRS